MRLAAPPAPSAGRHFRQSTAVALDRVVDWPASNLSWLLYLRSQMALGFGKCGSKLGTNAGNGDRWFS